MALEYTWYGSRQEQDISAGDGQTSCLSVCLCNSYLQIVADSHSDTVLLLFERQQSGVLLDCLLLSIVKRSYAFPIDNWIQEKTNFKRRNPKKGFQILVYKFKGECQVIISTTTSQKSAPIAWRGEKKASWIFFKYSSYEQCEQNKDPSAKPALNLHFPGVETRASLAIRSSSSCPLKYA